MMKIKWLWLDIQGFIARLCGYVSFGKKKPNINETVRVFRFGNYKCTHEFNPYTKSPKLVNKDGAFIYGEETFYWKEHRGTL